MEQPQEIGRMEDYSLGMRSFTYLRTIVYAPPECAIMRIN